MPPKYGNDCQNGGRNHDESHFDIVMVAIVGALIALVAVIVLGAAVGSF